MYDVPLRAFKDRITTPLCTFLPLFLTPNHLTLLSFLCGAASILCAALLPTSWLALAFWLLNRVLDSLDGTLARARGVSTSLGGFLDLLSDFVVYSLLPIGIGYGLDAGGDGDVVDWRAVAVLEASFHVNNFVLFYVAAVVSKEREERTSVAMRPALMEGFESGLVFTGMLVWPRALRWWCWGMGAAVVVGIVQRVGFVVPVLGEVDRRDREREQEKRGRAQEERAR